ncbi:DUF547 domain-containing protein [Maricaulaceae bacterium EIL42A08]|nr:DUF547 domain-containing protein [Maricaulaceae bacterium EIL42A08]
MRAILLFISLFVAGPVHAQSEDLHAPWDTLLASYLSEHPDGVARFDYAALRASDSDTQTLQSYISALEAAQPSQMSDGEAFAYWANLYNAVTVRLIVEEAPERSIRQIRPRPWSIGPWGMERVTVEGEELSLDNIEHDIMRPRYEAALVHYAVNCASIGCPNLKATAWRAEALQADLEAGARAYINHPRGVTVTEDGLVISRIYRWFREDFGDSEEGVIDHLLTFAEPELAAAIEANPRIDGHAYDWDLNRP